MPPQNRLAPTPNNALLYSVPQPYNPATFVPAPTRFNAMREAENLSIGLGRGSRAGLEGTKQLLTQPVATARALVEAARQVGTDPRIVLDMLRAARQKAMSGSLGLGELIGENLTPGVRGRRVPVMRELDVYHGTPRKFPATEANPLGEFDASKIGTGEGAQAYGHGIYLAESPKVGKGYATTIPYRNFVRKVAQVYDEFDAPADAEKALAEAGLTPAELRAMQTLKEDDYLGFDYPHQALEAALKEPESFDLSPKTKEALSEISSLYKADLPDEMIDRMLDWDKPLSQQPESVKKLVAKLPFETSIDNMSGRDILDAAEAYTAAKFGERNRLGGAKLLQSYGFPGIKYLDADSRMKTGEKTRNFIVFPGEEKKVRILERK